MSDLLSFEDCPRLTPRPLHPTADDIPGGEMVVYAYESTGGPQLWAAWTKTYRSGKTTVKREKISNL